MGVETRICPLYLCVGIWPVEAIVVDFINEQTNKQWNNSERETGREKKRSLFGSGGRR